MYFSLDVRKLEMMYFSCNVNNIKMFWFSCNFKFDAYNSRQVWAGFNTEKDGRVKTWK